MHVKTSCNSYSGSNKERGRPRKRWTYEVEEDLSIMGVRNGQAMSQRLSGTEKDCIGSQDPQRTVALEEKKKQHGSCSTE
jgi:hypothetical protein